MRAVLTSIIFTISAIGFCCLWDRDTVAAELKGMPKIQDVIAGRFERNPDLYYEMRLAREVEIDRNPFPQEYFDYAVACDRLGRHEEAIEWIAKFDRDPAVRNELKSNWKDLTYKRAANLGTFYIHRGLKKGDKGLEDMKMGLGLIEQAIKINPDAHFGREKVQAALVRQIIWRETHEARINWLKHEGKLDEAWEEELKGQPAIDLSVDEIREGVIGLMVLGQAWESVVAWEWLAGTMKPEDGHIRKLITLRIKEIDPSYKVNQALPEPLVTRGYEISDVDQTQQVFSALRQNGQKWAKTREQFMLNNLVKGKHPDKSDRFWDGYVEVPPLEIKVSVKDFMFSRWQTPLLLIIDVSFGIIAIVTLRYFWKRKLAQCEV